MRKIKFRGYNAKNKEWLYGCYILNRGEHFIAPDEFANNKGRKDYQVVPETIGQFTGLRDKNGKEIYEGDLLNGYGGKRFLKVVYFENAARFLLRNVLNEDSVLPLMIRDCKTLRVVGNIYDNPELLQRQ